MKDDNIKAITHIPGWAELLQDAEKVGRAENSFNLVPLVYRAVKLRCDALASVPIAIYEGENQIDWMFDTPLDSLIWKTEAGMLLNGAAFWLKPMIVNSGNGFAEVTEPTFINPFSVEVHYTGAASWLFQQPANGNTWTNEEMVYFREYDPLQDTHPGIAAADVALGDSRLLHYITRFGYHFFDGGAMPVTLLALEDATPEERDRIESRFKRMLTNVKNAFRILGVRAGIDIKTLTPPMNSLAMPELYDQAKKNLGAAFGIPTTMLEDPAANRATAESHRLSFWSDTVRPRGNLFADIINHQFLEPAGYRIEFLFDEIDIFQEDEKQRALSLKLLKEAGVPLMAALSILGFEINDEEMAIIEEAEQQKTQMRENAADAFGQQKPASNSSEDEEKIAALELWRKKAGRHLFSNRATALNFTSEHISSELNAAIAGALDAASDAEDIKRIFEDAKRWVNYP